MSFPQVQTVDANGNIIGAAAGGGSGAAYNGASAQVAQVSTFTGIAGFNGSTVDAIKTVNGGQVEVTLYSAAGLASPIANTASANPVDSATNAQSGLITNAWLSGFNGTTWDRIRDDVNKSLNVNNGAVSNLAVTGATAFVSAKTSGGRFFGLTAGTSGNGVVQVTDGSGGAVIGGLTSSACSAGVPIFVGPTAGVPFTTSLVVVGTASSPNVVVHFS